MATNGINASDPSESEFHQFCSLRWPPEAQSPKYRSPSCQRYVHQSREPVANKRYQFDYTYVCNQKLLRIIHSSNLGFTLRYEVVLLNVFLEQKFL